LFLGHNPCQIRVLDTRLISVNKNELSQLLTMAIVTFNAAGTSTNAGIFIPIADLPGVTSSELNPANSAPSTQANAVFGLLKQVYSVISPSSFAALGYSVGNSEAKPGVGLTTRTYSLTAQYLSDLNALSVAPIPVPGSGSNSGVGKFSITDVFPSAALVAASGSVSGAGIVIETSPLNNYGAPLQASLNPVSGQDNRNWFAALFNWMTDGGLTARVPGTTTSAITAANRSTPSAASLPVNATASSNPTTGITSSQLNSIVVNSITYTISIETIDNQSSDSFSVNVA
jgi:hypothetical protein